MSRRFTVFAFWILGFGIGFAAYLSLPSITQWFSANMPDFLNQTVVGALITGIIGSAVSTFTVITWANKTSQT
jgi:hypothetical protein